MTRKNWIIIAVLAGLAALSLYLNRDYFASEHIQIYHRSRALSGRRGRFKPDPNSLSDPVVFGFERSLKLTSIKVIPLSDIETNKYPHPIWELISDSNSVPTKDFIYGTPIRGMRPSVKGASADPLVPGIKYRLIIAAGDKKAEHDFEANPKTP